MCATCYPGKAVHPPLTPIPAGPLHIEWELMQSSSQGHMLEINMQSGA